MEIKISSKTYGEQTVIIDDDFYPIFKKYKWHLWSRPHKNTIYVDTKFVVNKKQITIKLHRMIMEAKPGEMIDHINGCGLDNRRSNLRIVTNAQNMQNQGKFKRVTYCQYKGVSKCRNSYLARITVNKETLYLGSFTSEIEAAKCYNEAALKYFGQYARLNILPSADKGR